MTFNEELINPLIILFSYNMQARAVTSLFWDRVNRPYELGKLWSFWGIWEKLHIFKMKNKLIISFKFAVIFKISVLSCWEVFDFLIALKKWFSKAIGNFSTCSWENTSLFAIGNGAIFSSNLKGVTALQAHSNHQMIYFYLPILFKQRS